MFPLNKKLTTGIWTHFSPMLHFHTPSQMLHFHTPWTCQKTKSFQGVWICKNGQNWIKNINRAVILKLLCYKHFTATIVSLKVFSGPYFPLLIQSEYRKIQTRNNSAFGHFSRSACFIVIQCIAGPGFLG